MEFKNMELHEICINEQKEIQGGFTTCIPPLIPKPLPKLPTSQPWTPIFEPAGPVIFR